MTEDILKIINEDKTEIITDINYLSVPCDPVDSIEEGEEIASKLFRVLNSTDFGIGLAANQIGIRKKVCVINVKFPIYLINPVLKKFNGELIYSETCLSLPNQEVTTKRYSEFFVVSDNIPGGLYCDVSDIKYDSNYFKNLDVLECIAIQHELSHLDGKTMYDFEFKQTPIVKDVEYGRNDRIEITNGIDVKIIKYKNFGQFEKNGYYIVKNV